MSVYTGQKAFGVVKEKEKEKEKVPGDSINRSDCEIVNS